MSIRCECYDKCLDTPGWIKLGIRFSEKGLELNASRKDACKKVHSRAETSRLMQREVAVGLRKHEWSKLKMSKLHLSEDLTRDKTSWRRHICVLELD